MAVCPNCGAQATQNTCSKCGLPFDLCVCVTIEREAEKIRLSTEMRRFNKPITIIDGITENAKDVATQLKSKLACGGTVKEGHIELQGNHKARAKEILIKLGYSEDQIEVE
jgi:translation initiation factor 1